MTFTTTIQFYHLLSTTRERAVPKLMEKILAAGSRAVLLGENEAALKQISDALWTHDPNGFLPHGLAREAHAADQPILLSTDAANANQADVLCILNGSMPEALGGYKKVLDLFDGTNDEAVTAARARWSAYKDQGYALQYVKQQPSGGWKIEMEVAAAA